MTNAAFWSLISDWLDSYCFAVSGLLLVAVCALLPGSAVAHQPSLGYLVVEKAADESPGLTATWDIALRDLDIAIDLDQNRDGRLIWGEVRTRVADIVGYAVPALSLSSDSQLCRAAGHRFSLVRRQDGAYARLSFDSICPDAPNGLALKYTLFSDLDSSHRLLVTWGGQSQSLTNDGGLNELPGGSNGAPGSWPIVGFIASGIHHILIGWDHLAFLTALLIAATLCRAAPVSEPVARATGKGSNRQTSVLSRTNLRELFWTVTAFTVAHSITLALATLELVQLPARPVEAVIAASICIAGLVNLGPQRWRRASAGPAIAFFFGLIHGFGFASVLAESGATGTSLIIGLLGFNLGVEVGQLLFVAVALPFLWILGHRHRVRTGSGAAISVVLVLMGFVWFVERVFNVAVI